MEEGFCQILAFYVFSCSFYICFRSLSINKCLVSISYFVSVPLREGIRGLEYQCSFVRLYLFLFAFLIICIETFGFRGLFCNSFLDAEVIFISGMSFHTCVSNKGIEEGSVGSFSNTAGNHVAWKLHPVLTNDEFMMYQIYGCFNMTNIFFFVVYLF